MKWHLSHEVFGTKPWDVQAEAMRRSTGKARYGYFLEQGLGKTPLTLNDFVDDRDVDLMLVVVPNSFKLDWTLAPDEWGQPDIVTEYWPRHPVPAPKDKTWRLYAINYEALISKAAVDLYDLLSGNPRVMMIIDEATSIKNPQAKQSKATQQLAKMARTVRVLNGTPLVQNVMDYYMPLRTLGELNGTNPYGFRNRYAVMGGFMGKQIKGINPEHEKELYSILDRVSFRALKKDWRDLPPKVSVPVHLEMTAKQRKHYDQMMEDFYTQVKGVEMTADLVLTQMNKLRQISSCLALQDGVQTWIEEPGKNPKLQASLDIVSVGNKSIVVNVHRASGAMLIEQYRKAGLDPAYIQGGMKPEEIVEQKNKFNKDPGCRVIVGQESATARGHTLLGGTGNDRCTKIVFFENSFSLMERLQIEDRNHRGEQDQTCWCYDLITSRIDQAVVDILQKKRNMADNVDAIVAVVRQHKRSSK